MERQDFEETMRDLSFLFEEKKYVEGEFLYQVGDEIEYIFIL